MKNYNRIKTIRDDNSDLIMLQIGGNTLQCILKKTRGRISWYESDTFSDYYSTIKEAKEHTWKLLTSGYFGEYKDLAVF